MCRVCVSCSQKTEHGFDLLDSRGKKQLKWMGVQADMWVLPEGAKVYLGAVRKENFDFFLRGASGDQSFRDSLTDKGKSFVDVSNDCAIYEAKQFEVPGQAEPVDVLQRQQTIGEYYTMHGTRGCNWSEYNSSARDILVYNEERDGFTRITLESGIDNCCRFQAEDRHSDGPLDWTNVMSNEVGTGDMFKRQDGQNCVRYGDMSGNALQREGLLDMSAGIMAGLGNCADIAKDIEAGLELCRQIEDAPADADFMAGLADIYRRHQVDPAAVANFDNERNLPEPPIDTTVLPTGYSNWAGMEVLAKPKYGAGEADPFMQGINKTAKAFVTAFNTLYSRLDEVVYDSCFLDADYQSPWFKKPDGRSTLFSSLAHMVQPPLWVTGGSPQAYGADGARGDRAGARLQMRLDVNGETLNPGTALPTQGTDNRSIISQYVPGVPAVINAAFTNNGDVNTTEYTGPNGLEHILAALLCSVTDAGNPARFTAPYTVVSLEEAGLMKETAQLFMGCMPPERANVNRDGKHVSYALALLFKLKNTKGVKLVDIYRLIRKISTAKTRFGFTKGLEALTAVVQAATAPGGAVTDLAAAFDTSVKNGAGGTGYTKISQYPNSDTGREHNVRNIITTALTGSASLAQGDGLSDAGFTIGFSYTEAENGNNARASAGARKNLKGRQVRAQFGANDTAAAGLGARMFGARTDPNEVRMAAAAFPPAVPGKKQRFSLGVSTWGDDETGGDGSTQMRETDTNRGNYVTFSDDFNNRYDEFNRFTNPCQRIIIQTFLGARICSRSMRQLVACDIPLPFGFLLFRPWMTYRMGTGILAKSGRETGETLIGHADFQLSDNVVQKMHYGNFTMYLKSIVIKQQNVYLAENMYAMGYVGGNDCRFFTSPNEVTDYMDSGCGRSMFSCLVPYDTRASDPSNCAWACDYPNPMDITGQFQHARLATNGSSPSANHYASCDFYSNYWQWKHTMQPDTDMPYFSTYSKWNTLCYQGHQAMYNPQTHQFDAVIENTGHWGNRVYPGCGRVRRGLQKLLEPVQYSTLYGGGTKSVVQLGV